MINFDQIDTKRISVLCKNIDCVKAITEFLKSKGFEIFIEKNPGSFFQSLNSIKPGFVLISHEMNDDMGRVFPNFIHKKFNIPVLLFHELGKTAALSNANEAQSPISAVKSVKQNKPEFIHEEIRSFQANYQRAMSKYVASAPSSAKNQQKSERHVRQEKLMKKISDKIKIAKHNLEQQDSLRISTMKVQDPNGQGFFLFVIPNQSNQSIFEKNLKQDLSLASEPGVAVEGVRGSIGQDFYQSLISQSDKVLQGFWGSQAITVLYYAEAGVSDLSNISVSDGGYLVPVEDWWSRLPLTFNAHIFLKENNKKLLYIKQGDFFPECNLRLFQKLDCRIFVTGKDFQSFQAMAEIANLAA